MKKRILSMILLILPVLTIGVESMPNSIQVWWREGLELPVCEYISFFGTLSDGSRPMGMAITGMATGVIFGFMVAYSISKKPKWLSAAKWSAAVAMVMASLPVIVQSEPMILPSALVYFMLIVQWILSMFLEKEEKKQEKLPQGKRIKNKR